MLGSLIIFLKGMRRMMFQLSGFYYNSGLLLDLADISMSARVSDGLAGVLRAFECSTINAQVSYYIEMCTHCGKPKPTNR